MRSVLAAALLLLLLLAPLVTESAIRQGGEWRGKAQSVLVSSGDSKGSSPGAVQWLLPPRRVPPYMEASTFRKASAPAEPPAAADKGGDAVAAVVPAAFPPVWRPSLLGEELVGSLARHTATDEYERSHGRYVDSFIHGQHLGFF